MLSTIRKVGNSTGAILPAKLLRELDLREGDELDFRVEEGKLVAYKVARTKPVFTLESLMENTDFDAIKNDADMQAWQDMPPAGRELL